MPNAATSIEKPDVLILGGTGFVGKVLIRTLTEAGYAVTVLSRQPSLHGNLASQPSVRVLALPISPDAHDADASSSLAKLLQGHVALVNLVGILNEPQHNGEVFEHVHVGFTKIALTAAHQAGVARYLHMSALGADAVNGSSFYLRSKGAAESWAHEFGSSHGIAVTSFRPSVIFGPGDSFLSRFAALARLMPGVFPLACAEARFAPVYVGDVCDQFLEALRDSGKVGQRLDLCGPSDYVLRDLVAYAARVSGHPRRVLPLPDWLARLQARALEFAPGKPFTRDNYASLQTASVCAPGCPRQPTRLEDIAPAYVGRSPR
ncbi:complex I NDUFA9 subunit family protein [Candidimonas sp. SYP-B2681]|uniref:complex I NDUFA9 subunit family protein n=1 Tax=Candidimonas sp. SYP-B2681 TaxID=2497686 RepID=UPI000F8741A5|nr:complex I NDUFA9 subunit family protein [Candidimonas sp. SYP-B2681]RTZ47610.1 complex I NDUFA9 subunit family protein [Candidimonas sp. SYP-B2681]